jgi:hypothetical protein
MLSVERIDKAISCGIEWIKRSFVENKLGWPRSRKEYEQTGVCSPCSTAESIEALAYCGEPLNSKFIRGGLAWFILNRDRWLKQEESVDFLIWGCHALLLSDSEIVTSLLHEAMSKLKNYQLVSSDPTLDNLIAERPVWPLSKKPLKVEKWGLYSTALTLKLYVKLLDKGYKPRYRLPNQSKEEWMTGLTSALKNNYDEKGKGWPLFPKRIAETCKEENPVDPFYTALIVESLLDSHEPLDSKYIKEPVEMLKNTQLESGGWAGLWPQREHGVETKYGDTETTSQVVVTLLKSGVPYESEQISKAIEFILNNQVRQEQNVDFGGFRLFKEEELDTVFNFSTFMALRTLDLYKGVYQSVERLKMIGNYDKTNQYQNAQLSRDVAKKRVGLGNRLPDHIKEIVEEKVYAMKPVGERRIEILRILDREGPLSKRDLFHKLKNTGKWEIDEINPKKFSGDITFLEKFKLIFKLPKDLYWTLYDMM